jgi:hypothetical protein
MAWADARVIGQRSTFAAHPLWSVSISLQLDWKSILQHPNHSVDPLDEGLCRATDFILFPIEFVLALYLLQQR